MGQQMADSPKAQFTRKKVNPSLADTLDQLKRSVFLSLNCVVVGTVQEFFPDSQTVSVTINWKKEYEQRQQDGTYTTVLKDYPILLDVPAVCLGGGTTSLTFPIASGDECIVLFCDRSIDLWWSSGQIGAPTSSRTHSISDGIAIVGVRSLGRVLEDYDTTRVALNNGTTRVAVGADKVLVENATLTLNIVLQELTTELTNLTTALALLTVAGVTPGGGVSGIPVNAAVITSIGSQITATATKIGQLLE